MALGHYRIRLRRHNVCCGHRVVGFFIELLSDLSVVLVKPHGKDVRELHAKSLEKGLELKLAAELARVRGAERLF